MILVYLHIYLHIHMAITFEPDTNACRYERFGYFLYLSMYPRAKLVQVHCSIRRTGIALHSQVQSPSRVLSHRRYHMDPYGMSIIFNEKGRKHGSKTFGSSPFLVRSQTSGRIRSMRGAQGTHDLRYVSLSPVRPGPIWTPSDARSIPTGRPGRPGTDKT